jgi:hypothetical protein
MLIGVGAGILDTIFGSDAEAEALERQKKAAWDQYLLGKQYSDIQYGMNRQEAQTQAAIQKGRLTEGLDRQTDQFNLGLLSQAYGIQNARIQAASGIGASLAAEGMSGTRGNDAGALMRAYEQTGLDRNVALQQRGNDLSLRGMLGQANDAASDIRREAASWDAGGYRYAQKKVQDDYNLAMAQLAQTNFDWQIEQAEWNWDSPGDWLNLFTSGLQGASAGLSLWNSWNEASRIVDGKKPAPSPPPPKAASVNLAPPAYTPSAMFGLGGGLPENSPYRFDFFDNVFNPSPASKVGLDLRHFSSDLFEGKL